MTSKNLFFNLMKENTKRRLWTLALMSLIFFFAFPVWTAMMLSDYLDPGRISQFVNRDLQLADLKLQLLNNFLDWTSINSGFVAFLMTVFAVLCAVSGFSYLHSKQKVDFFHSIPVKREKLFAAVYLNGIWYVAVPYLISLVLSSLLLQIKAAPSFPWGTVLTNFALHMAFFILLYSTAVLAVMMTGNTIVSLLGTAVFFLLGPAILMIKSGYCETYFHTWFGNTDFEMKLLEKSSPLAWYFSTVSENGAAGVRALCAIIAAAVITGLAMFLYKRRPSEAAGRAMAFKKSQPVIKILIVVPMALLGSLLFYEMKSSDSWSVFGLLCGLLITYCIVEIIYNFDFRRLFAHKLHLALCVVLSAAFFAFFRFDLPGYDSYIPSAESVDSGGFSSSYLDDQEYRVTMRLSEDNYVITHGVQTIDLLREMKLTDTEDILAIARAGIEAVKEEKERDPEEMYIRAVIGYHLKNGKDVRRSYYLDFAEVEEAFSSIYRQKEYKEALYPLLLADAADIAGINYKEYDDFSHVALPDDSMKAKLLTAYQKELSALTVETRKEESPIAALQFKTNEMQEMIDTVKADKGDYTVFNYHYYYPVYPSFTETIALLKQCGIEAGTLLNSSNVEKIEVRYYNPPAETSGTVITDKKQIDEILQASYAPILDCSNRLHRTLTGYDVVAFVGEAEWKKIGEENFDYYEETEQAEQEKDALYETYALELFENSVPDFLTEQKQ